VKAQVISIEDGKVHLFLANTTLPARSKRRSQNRRAKKARFDFAFEPADQKHVMYPDGIYWL
jgi:hypothetical protein